MRVFQFIKRRCGALVLGAVVAYASVYAIAFIQLYSVEHPYRVASRWIFDNVPAGSRISSPHWDDKVPVGIPGKDTAIYQMNGREYELPVYERDTPQMIEMIVRRIAASDYVTFATPRTPDSIPRIPEEYPNTTALIRLLWGERLGFSLVYTTKNRPSFLGLTFNDDLADESFSVYDHPKVVIFKNDQRLTTEQILDRIAHAEDYGPLPTMNEMLLMDRGGWVPAERVWRPEWSSYIRSLVLALVVGVCVWIIIGRAFTLLPDGGLGLSAGVGVVVAAGLGWMLSLTNVVPLTRAGGWFVTIFLVALAALKCILRESTRQRVLRVLRGHGLATCAAVAVGALVVSVMRSSDTTLLGMDERVDAAYLGYLLRSQESVPWDLFRPGHKLPFELADRFVLGWLLKLAGTPVAYALDTSFIVLGGLAAGVLYTILVAIVRRVKPALIGVLIMIIPAVYLLHVARDVTRKPVVPLLSASQLEGGEQLAHWVRKQISSTPLLVEACDEGASPSVAAQIGLPRYAAPAGSVDGAVCNLEEPEQLYQRMMGLKLELFLTPSNSSAASPAARSRYEKLSSRPDLFARVFEDQERSLFVPAFSRYYPRSGNR